MSMEFVSSHVQFTLLCKAVHDATFNYMFIFRIWSIHHMKH